MLRRHAESLVPVLIQMWRSTVSASLLLCGASICATTAGAQTSTADPDSIIKSFGGEAIREVNSDICFPATAEEYEALGKNAILMLRTSTAIATELPLKAVYVIYKGVRIPLHRIALLDKYQDSTSGRAIQVSFYLLPIQLMKVDSQILVDFSGSRKAFGIITFSAQEGLDAGAPAFARLDEYDAPGDADTDTVARVLAREYPDYIK